MFTLALGFTTAFVLAMLILLVYYMVQGIKNVIRGKEDALYVVIFVILGAMIIGLLYAFGLLVQWAVKFTGVGI